MIGKIIKHGQYCKCATCQSTPVVEGNYYKTPAGTRNKLHSIEFNGTIWQVNYVMTYWWKRRRMECTTAGQMPLDVWNRQILKYKTDQARGG